MARNIKRYYQAWELRQQGLIFKDIGKLMGITGSRAAVLSNFIDFKIKFQKQRRISNELKELIKKCRFPKPERGVSKTAGGACQNRTGAIDVLQTSALPLRQRT